MLTPDQRAFEGIRTDIRNRIQRGGGLVRGHQKAARSDQRPDSTGKPLPPPRMLTDVKDPPVHLVQATFLLSTPNINLLSLMEFLDPQADTRSPRQGWSMHPTPTTSITQWHPHHTMLMYLRIAGDMRPAPIPASLTLKFLTRSPNTLRRRTNSLVRECHRGRCLQTSQTLTRLTRMARQEQAYRWICPQHALDHRLQGKSQVDHTPLSLTDHPLTTRRREDRAIKGRGVRWRGWPFLSSGDGLYPPEP